MSELEKEVREALERAGADDLGVPRARHYREPEPLPDSPGWGPLSFLQPATPWHLVGIGVASTPLVKGPAKTSWAAVVLLGLAAPLSLWLGRSTSWR